MCGIYPEGTRSHDGKLYRGRTGVARLALDSGAPVIPVAVINTDVVAPPGKVFGKFARPGVRFGQPLDFSRYEGMQDDRYVLRAIESLPDDYRTVIVLCDLQQLSYQEIAQITGLSLEAVKTRIHRGRLMLRRKVDAYLRS